MKTQIVALMALVAILVLPPVLYAQETDPVSVVNAWHDALNGYDVDTALSYRIMKARIFRPQLSASG